MKCWKQSGNFPIEFEFGQSRDDRQAITAAITAPRGIKPLHVGIDPKTSATCIWGRVDTEKNKVKHRVTVFGTGHELTKGHAFASDYVGTVITPQGFVWHYFIQVKP